MTRITIAVPEAHVADANHLALCLGYGPSDGATYGPPRHEDAAGNRYSVASAVVGPAFVAAAQAPLAPPSWPADMAAAARAQSLIRLHGEETPVTAAPGHIAAVIHDDPQAALAMLGMTRIEADPDA